MIKIIKSKSEKGYCFTILTDDGKFKIFFAGNLDLYWGYLYEGSLLDQASSKQFTITREDYYLYSLFDELYENVRNCNICTLSDIDISLCEDSEKIAAKRIQNEKFNESLGKSEEYNPERLFQNGMIEWHSDDSAYEESSVLKIKKDNDTFIIIFEKGKSAGMCLTYSVCFANSGSRHEPFNLIFMKMYNKLKNYEPECHQIHNEECLHQEKLLKRR